MTNFPFNDTFGQLTEEEAKLNRKGIYMLVRGFTFGLLGSLTVVFADESRKTAAELRAQVDHYVLNSF